VSIEVKPGRWRMRNGRVVEVVAKDGSPAWPWRGHGEHGEGLSWSQFGTWGVVQGPFDLAEYLGPEEQTGGVQ
jgi:hypothetical protein